MNYYESTDSSSIVFYQFKIILLGDSGVGKTSLLSRYMEEGFIPNRPCTVNVDFKIKNLKIDKSTSAKITIWDTCGQEKYRAMTYQYFKDAQGIVLLYDVTDRESFNNLNIWLEQIEKNMFKEDLSIILVGNKIDLNFRNVTYEEAEKFAEKNYLMYCETSSKEGINVEDAFEMLTKNIIDKEVFNNSKVMSLSSVKAVKGKMKNEFSCC